MGVLGHMTWLPLGDMSAMTQDSQKDTRQLWEFPKVGTVLETDGSMVAAQGQGRMDSEMII